MSPTRSDQSDQTNGKEVRPRPGPLRARTLGPNPDTKPKTQHTPRHSSGVNYIAVQSPLDWWGK